MMKNRRKSVLGFVLFARVPVVTEIAASALVDYRGEQLAYVQRESLSTYLLFKNTNSNNPGLFWSTFQQLKRVLRSA